MQVRYGLPDSIAKSCARVPFGHCLCGQAARDNRLIHASHIDEHHTLTYAGITPHGHYCVPIRSEGQVLGVLNLYVPDGHQHSQEEDLFVRAIADTLAGVVRRKRAEDELLQAAMVFENATEGVVITDRDVRIVKVNRAITEITGYEAQELLGVDPRIWRSERQDRAFFQAMWAVLHEKGEWRGEIWNRHKNGAIFPCWQTIRTMRNDQGEVAHYISILTDISTVKESQAHAEYLAHHDPLTDLPNRRLLYVRLEHALEKAHRNTLQVGVIFLDLDRFKHINDSLGHPAGDALLQQVATRLRARIRDTDTLGRLGGDEFTLILEELSAPQEAGVVAQKILDAFSAPFELCGEFLHVSPSLGISLYPEDGRDAETLMKNADIAMYRAKEAGRNTYRFYTPEYTACAVERVRLEADLRRALARQEFVLYFQPQFDLNSGTLIGAEALIRWRHPELGLVLPDHFIPLAEETGLIVPIGEWVLDATCAQLQTWREAGVAMPRIAINVAGKQLRDKDFYTGLRRRLDALGGRADWLAIEITEGIIMEQAERGVDMLRRLQEMGIELALDDFGTGSSSLGHLKRLPLTCIKIDRRFIQDLPASQDARCIATAIIGLSKGLQLKVLAEGVETEAQRRFLIDAGCDAAQGYLFGHPVPADEWVASVGKGQHGGQ